MILFGLIAISTVLIILICLIVMPINSSLSNQYNQLSQKCDEYKQKFDKPQTKAFNLFDVVQKGFTNNERIITSYDAISAVIPEKVWITSIGIDENLNATIQGKAYNVEDIVRYYENLLSVSKFNNFKIKSIKAVGENSGPSSNTPDVSINPTENNSAPTTTTPQLPGNGLSGAPTLPAQQSGSPMLPPPPSSGDVGSSIAAISGPKYYEFDLGNPIETSPINANQPEEQPKGIIPNMSDLSKNLKLGN
jgi:hypothetical protein